jgi:hypothetical protein
MTESLAKNTLYAPLVRDAFNVLDHYRAALGRRDPVKSLDEDGEELLRRVRAALEPLAFEGLERRDDVAQILRRIDELHAGAE